MKPKYLWMILVIFVAICVACSVIPEEEETAPTVIHGCTVEVGEVIVDASFSGAKVAVIPITWTNGTDETAPYYTTLTTTVYEDGIECAPAYFMRMGSLYAESGSDVKIKPGDSFTVYERVIVDEDTTELEISIASWLSWSGDETYTVTRTIN